MVNLTGGRPVIFLVIKRFPSENLARMGIQGDKEKEQQQAWKSWVLKMLCEFYRLFVDLIEECDKNGQCLDHHGFKTGGSLHRCENSITSRRFRVLQEAFPFRDTMRRSCTLFTTI